MKDHRKRGGCLRALGWVLILFSSVLILFSSVLILFGIALWTDDNSRWEQRRAENAEWYAEHESLLPADSLATAQQADGIVTEEAQPPHPKGFQLGGAVSVVIFVFAAVPLAIGIVLLLSGKKPGREPTSVE